MTQNSMTLNRLLDQLKVADDTALIFRANDQPIRPGYHVTEIKCADVRSIDCGRGDDQWTEVIVQLLDGPSGGRGDYMSVSKFRGILAAAGGALSADDQQRLFFEFASDNGPLKKYTIAELEQREDQLLVDLLAETAVCKPFQRLASSPSQCC